MTDTDPRLALEMQRDDADAGAELQQQPEEMLRWPQVVAYPGGGAPEGLGAWVDISTGDGPEHVYRYVRDDASPWQPIETAPREGREMFVVRAFRVSIGFPSGREYTTDPWCVWRQDDGSFARWPHHFEPTHWMPLPPPPAP